MQNTSPPLDFEDILADHSGGAPPDTSGRIETPIRRRSLTVLFIVVLLLFGGFAARVFSLSVLQGALFSSAAERSRERTTTLPAPRGAVLDRNGTVLTANTAAFALIFDPLAAQTVNAEERAETIAAIAVAAGIAPDDLTARLTPYEGQSEPRAVLWDLPQEQAVALAVSIERDFLRVEPVFRRSYPLGGEIFAPVLGYLGAVTPEDRARSGFGPREMIGKDGVERAYDADLRGAAGTRTVTVDARGRPQGEPAVRQALPGANLVLTIDAELTNVLHKALADAMRQSRATGAAAVAIDPRDGAVLALVSMPSYDPAVFGGDALPPEAFAKMANDPRKPFLNRAINGLYPSGSTIKPFIGAAAVTEKIVSSSRKIDASQGFIRVASIYDPNVSWTFRDWKAHGFVNLAEAIARSANVYFYTVGGGYGGIAGLGVERIARYLEGFGFGRVLGIDLPGEANGRIPTPEWKEREIGEPWYIGDTYNLSIGQGDFAVTPLQLAAATAAIANGGMLYQPRIADAIMEPGGAVRKSFSPQTLRDIPVSAEAIDAVRRGMRLSVTASFGTNRALADLSITAAAKTGTAQFGGTGKTHALVTAFAPYAAPELVLAVVLEGGGEGTVATRVAKEALAWYAAHYQ